MPRKIKKGITNFPRYSRFIESAFYRGDKDSLARLRKFFRYTSKLTQKRMLFLDGLLKRRPQKFYDLYCSIRLGYQALFAELLAGLEKCNFKVDMKLFAGSASEARAYSHDFYRIKGINLKLPEEFQLAVILEWFDHKNYDRKFGYKTS